MKKLTILFLLLFLLFSKTETVFAQTGKLSGSVFMPVVKKERRTFRGRLYRNRLSSKKDFTETDFRLKRN